MSEAEQAGQLAREIQRVINRAKAEYSLSFAACVGVLEIVKLELFMSQREEANDE